jgi:hypothetical protein
MEVASNGWSDDEGTARREKKISNNPTAEKPAPNAVCCPMVTAFH